jgi:hypothetical protein
MQTCEATNEMATKQSFEGWPGISINQQNTYWLVETIDLPEKVSQQTCSKSFVWPAVCHLPDLSITPSGLGSKSDILCCILSKMWTKFDMFLEMFSDEREFSDGFCWDSWRRADGIFRHRTSFWADTLLCPTVSKEVQSVGVQKLRS